MKYKMTLDFIVDIPEHNGICLTVEDIANALNNSGYKTEFVKNMNEGYHSALYVYGNYHRLDLMDGDGNPIPVNHKNEPNQKEPTLATMLHNLEEALK